MAYSGQSTHPPRFVQIAEVTIMTLHVEEKWSFKWYIYILQD